MAELSPLATLGDLSARGLPVAPADLANALLASVSAAVREAAGVAISRATTTLELAGTREQFLPLHVSPVVSVTDVTLDGAPVTDWKLRDGRLWRSSGWGAQHRDIAATVTYGYDPVPADIVQLVCSFVGAAMISAESEGSIVRDRGMSYERIDDYQYGLRTGDDEIVDITGLPERVKASLRARFSGQTHVIGTY